MARYAIYAAGACYTVLQSMLKQCPSYEQIVNKGGTLVALTDGNPNLWGVDRFGQTIIPPSELSGVDFEKIIVCSFGGADDIKDKLINEYNVPESKIEMSCQEIISFLHKQAVTDFANIVYNEKIPGSVAECGVFKGQFAEHINNCFPDRKLWLFDTFKGFDERDTAVDKSKGFSGNESDMFLKYPHIDKVKTRLPYSEQAVFKVGYFPDTTVGDEQLANEQFVFVHLDFDLYQPILAGLEYFYPKMVSGGIIHIHDFFTPYFQGASQAVKEFCVKQKTRYIPIGDGFTVAIIKL